MAILLALRCLHCGAEYPPELIGDGCRGCREPRFVSNLVPVYDDSELRRTVSLDLFERRPPMGVWRFKELLPVPDEHQITLGEASTPLLRASVVGPAMGLPHLYLKDESRNPTFTFKDRQSAVAVSWASMAKAPGIALSSSGNQGSSYAAFAARAGLPCAIFTFPEASPVQRHQMQALGAKLIATPVWTDRWKLVELCVTRFGWHAGSNYTDPPVGAHPIGMEGYKTFAYEIVLQLARRVPDYVVFPCGHGDGLFGAWRGFCDLHGLGLVASRPRMVAAEVIGPVTKAVRERLPMPVTVPGRATAALSIATTTAPYHAMRAVQDSGGLADTVTDEEILWVQRELARKEAVYGEPSSVASVALARKLRAAGVIREEDTVVCVITASGLKDPGAMEKSFPAMPVIPPDLDALVKAMKESYGFSL